jgi:DNA polymerase (family 10)
VSNREIADLFDEMAAALRLEDANPFRAASDARVARVLRSLGEEVGDWVRHSPATAIERLAAIPGIGERSAARIVERVQTGGMGEHEKLLARVPSGLFELLEVPGIGPKAVRRMWQELGIVDVDGLRTALDSGQLASLPRFGDKSLKRLRQSLDFQTRQKDRVSIGVALPLARTLVEVLSRVEGVERLCFAGSLRRGCETVGDIDLLATTRSPEKLTRAFTHLEPVSEVLAAGPTRSSVRLEKGAIAVQVDLRIVPEESWGAALLYFTGSREHSVLLREIAIRQDKHLNEYGLYAGLSERPQDAGHSPLASRDESSIYEALGLPWIAPELREEAWRPESAPRSLMELADVRAELHSHTVASDGRLGIEQMAREARRRGMRVLAITDHSASSVIANGLDRRRLLRHVEAIRRVDRRLRGIRVLAGAEVDILPDGRLDYDDATLARLDLVVASPHVSLGQGSAAATERLLRAVGNPHVHILGHATGRLVGRREGLHPDLARLFEAAAEHRTALEINANPRRLDLRDHHARSALEHGCLLAVNTDAHSAEQLDLLEYGVATARRGGLPAERCINCWPTRQLMSWLKRRD